MTSAGKWVLGLLLLVVGAVFVARTISSEPDSQARVELPAAESAAAGKESEAAKAAAAAAKKAAAAPATDLACKKACVEVNEVANDSVTTAKLAPGSVTLSKLAFEVPNLNELVNEINARRAAEASAKAAIAEAAAATAQNDASISAAAANGLSVEAAARTAAIEKLSKEGAAADAAVLTKLSQELTDRSAADDVLQGKLNTEIADRAGAIANLRTELGNPNQVGAPIIQINNNEIVGDAVTSNKILDGTITADDLGNDSVVGGLGGDVKDESITHFDLGAASVGTSEVIDDSIAAVDLANNAVIGRGIAADAALVNVKERTLRGERTNNTTAAVSAGDLALGTITGEVAPLAGAATGNIALGTIGTGNLSNGAVTFAKLDSATQDRITNLESGLAAEIAARAAADSALQTALNNEIASRIAGDSALQTALNSEIASRIAGDSALQTALTAETGARTAGDSALAAFDSSLATDAPSAATLNGAKAPNPPTASEGLVDWSRLKDVPTGFADNVDDDGATGLNTYKNELKADGTPDANTNPVSFGKIKDLTGPGGAGRITGAFIKDGDIGIADLATDAVSGRGLAGVTANIRQGSIKGEGAVTSGALGDVALGSITGQGAPSGSGTITGNIALGTITAANLAPSAALDNLSPDSITAGKIGSGQVGNDELAQGAVTADKQRANASAGTGGASIGTVSGVAPAATTTLLITSAASENHRVLLTGQTTITCSGCVAGSAATITYQLFDDTTAVGPEMTANLTNSRPEDHFSLSGIAISAGAPALPSPPGPALHTYTLRVTVTGLTGATPPTGVTLSSGGLTAVDLGLA